MMVKRPRRTMTRGGESGRHPMRVVPMFSRMNCSMAVSSSAEYPMLALPVAPTLLAKALELVVQKESRPSGCRRNPLSACAQAGSAGSATYATRYHLSSSSAPRGDQKADWGVFAFFSFFFSFFCLRLVDQVGGVSTIEHGVWGL